MRKCALVLLIMLTLAPAVRGQSWGWAFIAGDNVQEGTSSAFGAGSFALDGYDSSDDATAPGAAAYLATYHNQDPNGGAWDGPTGFYWYDYRAPVNPGQSKTWTLYFWGSPTFRPDLDNMSLWWGNYGYQPPPGLDVTLTLTSKPEGITGGPAIGTTYDLRQHPTGLLDLPVYRTTNGLDGYVFYLTATAVPEPSALAALGFGLLPLGGFALRRRSRRQRMMRGKRRR